MTNDLIPFWGDKQEQHPTDFLRASTRDMHDFPDEHKAKMFVNYLRADSYANDWWFGLDSSVRGSWPAIEAAFAKKWPDRSSRSRTKDHYVSDLLAIAKLTIGELVEGLEGSDRDMAVLGTWQTVGWADRVEVFAETAGVLGGNRRVPEVLEMLPVRMQMRLEDWYDSWAEFLEAVRALDLGRRKTQIV